MKKDGMVSTVTGEELAQGSAVMGDGRYHGLFVELAEVYVKPFLCRTVLEGVVRRGIGRPKFVLYNVSCLRLACCRVGHDDDPLQI